MAKDKQQQKKKAKKHQKAKVAVKAADADVFTLQEKLFALLDKAKLAPATILNSEKHKEHYETLAMFAFRKREAAKYHAARVDALYEAHRAEARRFLRRAKKPKGDLKITSVSSRYSRSANEFVHELSAFFGRHTFGSTFLLAFQSSTPNSEG